MKSKIDFLSSAYFKDKLFWLGTFALLESLAFGFKVSIFNFILKYQLTFLLLSPFIFILVAYLLYTLFLLIKRSSATRQQFFLNGFLPVVIISVLYFYITQCFSTIQSMIQFEIGVTLVIVVAVLLFWIVSHWFIYKKPIQLNGNKSELLEDSPNEQKDALEFKAEAKKFASLVWDNGSSARYVFGIDAPWGSGKTTFIQYFKKELINTNGQDVEILEFNPLQISEDNLLKQFLTEISERAERLFDSRALKRLFARYIERIEGDVPPSLKFLKMLLPGTSNFDTSTLFAELEEEMQSVRKKMIVVIDDLDRLPKGEIKLLLDLVRVSLRLPSISFVLCFDTSNINAYTSDLKKTTISYSEIEKVPTGETKSVKGAATVQEDLDNKKIAEYFEKIVNVKITLGIRPSLLKKYLLDTLLSDDGSQRVWTERAEEEIRNAFENIFSQENFFNYRNMLGDLRKVKRLINQLRFLVGFSLQIDQTDIDFSDMVYLILLYINHPRVYRDIYMSDIESSGLFSLERNIGSRLNGRDKKDFVNKKGFNDYVSKQDSGAQILLKQLFSESRFEKDNPLVDSAYAAAFNGGFDVPENLREYLRIISNSFQPSPENERKSYFQMVQRLSKGETLNEVIDQRFVFLNENNGERAYMEFFGMLSKHIRTFSFNMIAPVITWMIEHAKDFSTYEASEHGLGLRERITLDVLYYLDERGWKDKNGKNNNNSITLNIASIGETLIDGLDNQPSIMDLLLDESNGVLGVYDAIKLRLHCSRNRGGRFYNLYKSLKIRSSKQTGDDIYNEMRELTQVIFNVFRQRYIEKGECLFEDVEALSEKEIFGNSMDWVEENLKKKGKLTNLHIQGEKSSILSFIMYQIGNNRVNQMDMGFGVFDISGDNDEGNIKEEFNNYLFSHCFNPGGNNGCQNFCDYLLLQYERKGHGSSAQYLPRLQSTLLVLDRYRVIAYWNENKEKICDFAESNTGRIVHSRGYSASYKEHLPEVFNELDTLSLTNPESENSMIVE